MVVNLRAVRWILALLPAFMVGAFEWWRHTLHDYMPQWIGNSLAAGMAVLGSVLYYKATWKVIERLQAEVQAQRARESVLRERERIARDLHDSISQALFFCNVELQSLERHLEAGDGEAARTAAREVRRAVAEAYEQVRRTIFDLRLIPETVPSEGVAPLRPTLHELLGEFTRQTGIAAELTGTDPVALPARARAEILRIVREALWNVRKHAGASRVAVALGCRDGRVYLSLADDGTGFDPEDRRPGFGIQSMRERAHLLGGSLEVRSEPGCGTRVQLVIPASGGSEGHGDGTDADRGR